MAKGFHLDDEEEYSATHFLLLLDKMIQYLKTRYTGNFWFEMEPKGHQIFQITLKKTRKKRSTLIAVTTLNLNPKLTERKAYIVLEKLQLDMEDCIRGFNS